MGTRRNVSVIVIQGRCVSEGTAQGRLHCYHRVGAATNPYSGCDPAGEKARLIQAQAMTREQLESLAEKCRREVGGEAASIFDTHAMMVEDENYIRYIEDVLLREQCCAEYAVQQSGKAFAAVFEKLDDPYMRERGADVMDVTWRLLRNLAGAGGGGARLKGPAVVAAEDFNLTEFIQLDREQVLAVVTRRDSQNSHAAIITRLLGIPAVCALGEALRADYHGRMVRVDGAAGTLTIF